jgi:cytochrome c oxidase subunit 2
MMFRGYTRTIDATRRSLRGLALTALSALVMMLSAQGAWAADAAKGQMLFGANCSRCHNPKLEKPSTGPALLGVSSRIPGGDWKYRWVKNSNKLIGEGEPYAVKVWTANNKASMDPMPHLTDADIDDLFAFIDAYQPVANATTTGGTDTGPTAEEEAALSSLWSWIRLLIFVIVVLLGGIAMQIARLRGVEFLAGVHMDKLNARLFAAFFIFGMIGTFWSVFYYQPYYIQSHSASVHGEEIDRMFWITMVVVFSVFVITNGILFYFAWKYGKDGDRKAKYYPENHKLELIWTVVPAIVLTVLVIFGIKAWTGVMRAPDPNLPTLHVEVSGQQWGWILRYTGDDKKFGALDVRRIGGDNILGVDVADKNTADDFIAEDLVMQVGQTVDLKIRSRDVLHSVYLPHFRVKMDAVPGMDTRFHFVPKYTTTEYRKWLKENNPLFAAVDTIITTTIAPDSNAAPGAKPITVVDTVFKADNFDFELACTEVCGRGHFSMRKKVVVLSKEEYDVWYAEKKKATILSQMGGAPAADGDTKISSAAKSGQILDNN